MNKHIIRSLLGGLVLAVSGSRMSASAQAPLPPPVEIPLYAGVAPGSQAWNWHEQSASLETPDGPVPVVQNVVQPTLVYFPADKGKAVGTAVIVAPGGAFRVLVMSFEGMDTAKRLNEMGIDAFVLKYRLVFTKPGHPAMAAATSVEPGHGVPGTPQAGQNLRVMAGLDGQQAVRVLRQRAAEFGLRPDRIGMMGFSAGGYVTVAAATGPADGRPDFAAPIYPAAGFPAVSELVMTPPPGAPPLFLAVAADDERTGWQGAVELYTAWRKAAIPAELHIFQVGGHGFRKKQGGVVHYLDRFEEWLRLNGWLTKNG